MKSDPVTTLNPDAKARVNEPRKRKEKGISESLIQTICERLAGDERVRRSLPEKGRLHIDRQLPFLIVYRRRENDLGTDRLVTGEAAYLIAPGGSQHRDGVAALVQGAAKAMSKEFGAYLILEIWAGDDEGAASDAAKPSVPPVFRIIVPESAPPAKVIDILSQRLSRIKVLKQEVEVEVVHRDQCKPPGLRPLISSDQAAELHCSVLGLVVPPVYRDAKTGQEFPPLLRSFRSAVGHALKPAFYRFARSQTIHRPPHYHELGRRAVVKAVWDVDRKLSEVSSEFDFLLQVTPINSSEAWQEFEQSGFQSAPEFHYRPTPFDPASLKRQLYDISIDHVEDPALQYIFQEKQEELDRKITMLRDRDTPRFLYGGLQVYGGVTADLVEQATELLNRPRSRTAVNETETLDAKGFAARAEKEFDQYRSSNPTFTAKTKLTKRVAGVMVSRGALLINPNTTVPGSRVEALLQHEVGTHLVTYFNGKAQPFRQLGSGLAGYEELQEGVAVLAEYLVGGLTQARVRQLAARVVAVRDLIDGASFVETFRVLVGEYGLTRKSAFKITMRVYRGGGLTKDAIYLRGLGGILSYLGKGGELDPLLVGKIAVEHVPIIKELQLRQVLKPTPIRPQYLQNKNALARLSALQETPTSVSALLDTPPDEE